MLDACAFFCCGLVLSQLLRFDQPVAPLNVSSKHALDAFLAFDPPDWAVDYSGSWLSSMALLVTVQAVAESILADSVFRARVGVGSLGISTRPSGNLTSLDGTSTPSNASTVLAHGSWGEVVCDGVLYVHSNTAIMAAFRAPANSSYAPASYNLTVSASPAFDDSTPVSVTYVEAALGGPSPAMASPPWVPSSALRYLLPALAPDVTVYVRVAAAVPVLPPLVSRDLRRAVQPVAWPLGGDGGCQCASVVSGSGCRPAAVGSPQGSAPTRPVICKGARHTPRHTLHTARHTPHVARYAYTNWALCFVGD
jgi:hypothetical protein